MGSILTEVKKVLGIDEQYTHFDTDIIIHINTVLLFLAQLGVGSESPYSIKGKEDTWAGIFGDRTDMEAVKTYVALKVKLIFDPPSSSAYLESLKKVLEELECRINIQAELKA